MEMQSQKKKIRERINFLDLRKDVVEVVDSHGICITDKQADDILKLVLEKISTTLKDNKDFMLNNICTLRMYTKKEGVVNTAFTNHQDVIVPAKHKIKVMMSKKF